MAEFLNENEFGLGVDELAIVDSSGQIVYRLPKLAGSEGQALVTDGLGNAYWGVPNYTGGFAPGVDAFGRQRVSNPHTIFNSKQIFDNQPLLWDDQEVEPGNSPEVTTSTHSVIRASTTLGVPATTDCRRVRQTFKRFNYQPGKSQLVMMTGVFGLDGGGITKSMGMFDDFNGIFVSVNDDVVSMNLRSSVTFSTTTVDQADWNFDPMDGTGPSGITLDITKAQIIWFDFEWLGVGSVRTGFVIDDKFILCHEFKNSNAIASVYMSTPNLPLRIEIDNDGTGNAATIEQICATVISEGGAANGNMTSNFHSINTDNAGIAVGNGDRCAIIGFRNKTSHVGQAIDVGSVSIVNGAKDSFEYEWRLNPTIAGTYTWADHSPVSGMQTFIGDATNLISDGQVVLSGVSGGAKEGTTYSSDIPHDITFGQTIDGTRHEMILCVKAYNTSAAIDAAVNWRELD